MNYVLPQAFDEFEYLHDWRDGELVTYEARERADAMISLADQLRACHAACEQLLLHVCSRFKSDEMLSIAASAEAEAALAVAQAQHLARFI